MPATIIAIADAVVAQLNATSFSQPLQAERHYLPQFELSEMTELRASVVPRSVASKGLDRNRDSFDYRNALGAYIGLLQAHHESQAKVRAVRPGATLLEEAQVQAAIKAARDAEQQAVADLEKLRALVF